MTKDRNTTLTHKAGGCIMHVVVFFRILPFSTKHTYCLLKLGGTYGHLMTVVSESSLQHPAFL